MNIKSKKPHGYWTFEKCKEKAFKYHTKINFKNNYPSAYSKARTNGWLDDICIHMSIKRKKDGYWSYKNCKEEVLKYKKISDFSIYASGAYSASYRNNWLDEFFPKIK